MVNGKYGSWVSDEAEGKKKLHYELQLLKFSAKNDYKCCAVQAANNEQSSKKEEQYANNFEKDKMYVWNTAIPSTILTDSVLKSGKLQWGSLLRKWHSKTMGSQEKAILF